jgi:hypothetical protein
MSGPPRAASRVFSAPITTAVVAAVLCSACSDPDRERLKATTKASYDTATGKLTELTFDSNRNGRIDTWTEMDGTRPVRSRLDSNEDGRVDRWEYYDGEGRLAKVGFSRANGDKPDAWAYSTSQNRIERIEVSSTSDERRVDRWEYYDTAAATGPDGTGPLLRVETDMNHDGARDKWERYQDGVVKTVEFDENHDGKPDRRLTYDAGELVAVETGPDGAGGYLKRVVPGG